MGDTELARKHLREALSLLGERTGTVRLGYYTTHFTDIGLRLIRLGDLSGIELIEEDVRYFRQREQPVGEAYTLLALGTAQNSSERPEEAIVVFEKALMLFRKLADRFGEAMVLHHMARTELARNRVSEALLLCERAASLCDVPANPVNRAHVLLTTSRALHRLGRGSEAAEAAAEAAAILESLGHKHASEARSIVNNLSAMESC
jgi:tetratricopeptide (TPR) repeat protein